MTQGLRIRAAEPGDAERLWQWANDPATRTASFSGEPIPWETHLAWLGKRLADPTCLLLVAEELAGTPVGVVRFETTADRTELSITLAPEHRGRGLAARVLLAGVRELFIRSPVTEVHAFVRPENAASLRAFERAAFIRVPSPRPDAVCFIRKREQ